MKKYCKIYDFPKFSNVGTVPISNNVANPDSLNLDPDPAFEVNPDPDLDPCPGF
jgi:hypothetical protein